MFLCAYLVHVFALLNRIYTCTRVRPACLSSAAGTRNESFIHIHELGSKKILSLINALSFVMQEHLCFALLTFRLNLLCFHQHRAKLLALTICTTPVLLLL